MGGVPESSPEPDAERQRVVLVVEDEVMVRSDIASYLRDVGFVVVEAATAAEAQAVFASETTVDVVFADVRLPGDVDGFMLADWIARHHPHVPVLATSGSFSLRDPAILASRRFIAKPYIFYQVETRLRELIAESGRR